MPKRRRCLTVRNSLRKLWFFFFCFFGFLFTVIVCGPGWRYRQLIERVLRVLCVDSRSVPSRNNAWKVFDRPPPSNYHRETPYVEIIEQPAAIQKDIRRACASVSAARIVGANSTPENKTYPTIRVTWRHVIFFCFLFSRQRNYRFFYTSCTRPGDVLSKNRFHSEITYPYHSALRNPLCKL